MSVVLSPEFVRAVVGLLSQGPAAPSTLPDLRHTTPQRMLFPLRCSQCDGEVEQYPGRPGRPRAHCETCRPPSWPRRGELWFVRLAENDPRTPVYVLGTRRTTWWEREDGAAPVEVRVRRWDDVTPFSVSGPDWRQNAVRRLEVPCTSTP